MKPLEETYRKSFFKSRWKLEWRAESMCSAVSLVFGLREGEGTVIDVGCAVGEYVAEFNRRGVDAYGIEGSRCAKDYFLCSKEKMFICDLRLPLPIQVLFHKYDLCMSLEVAEHIEPEHADSYVQNLCSLSPNILITAAQPSQGGHYHVNCQPKEYWEDKFFRAGYSRAHLKEQIFKDALKPVSHRKEIAGYLANVMIFRR